MKHRGLLVVLLAALAIAYFLFFAKVGDKTPIEVQVDAYFETKVEMTEVNMESLAREVLSYAAGGEGLPGVLEDLRRSHPAAAALRDAWGRPFRYERLSDDGFRLTSAGPDGDFGTADDIVKDH